jgi:hypothetical protein
MEERHQGSDIAKELMNCLNENEVPLDKVIIAV